MSTVLRSGDNFYNVHLGFWTNWSKGKINGATVTLTRQDGGFLVAFLALFVGIAGTSFWRIGCFLIHHYSSSDTAQDGIYHQRQAILRNSFTAQTGAFQLVKAICAWKDKGKWSSTRRLLPLLVFAIVLYAAFGVAGIFSSHVTTQTANEVLIRSSHCGLFTNFDERQSVQASNMLDASNDQRATSFLNYALQCYGNNSNTQDCNTFVKPRLSFSTSTNYSCPFEEEMCKTKSSFRLDTKYLDSNDDLGINAPTKDRFRLRVTCECAPITTEGFSQVYQDPNDSGSALKRYFYGNISVEKFNKGFSYEVPVDYSSKRPVNGSTWSTPAADYTLGILYAVAGNSEAAAQTSRFTPIPQLQRSDADVLLFLLSAPAVIFSQEIDDPWYSAHTTGSHLVENFNETVQGFWHDEPASPLGCAAQYQICNPNLANNTETGCSPLQGNADLGDTVSLLWPNGTQQEAVWWAVSMLWSSAMDLGGLTSRVGISALTARYFLASGVQWGLPDNQWQLELQHWFGAVLASFQAALVEAANGPPDPTLYQFLTQPNDTTTRSVCNNQRAWDLIILVVGTLLILLDFTIEPLTSCIERKRRRGTYALLEWRMNASLQLQRLAHEGVGIGTWSRTDEENPIALVGEPLGILDIDDEKHPLLERPNATADPTQKPTADAADSLETSQGHDLTSNSNNDNSDPAVELMNPDMRASGDHSQERNERATLKGAPRPDQPTVQSSTEARMTSPAAERVPSSPSERSFGESACTRSDRFQPDANFSTNPQRIYVV